MCKKDIFFYHQDFYAFMLIKNDYTKELLLVSQSYFKHSQKFYSFNFIKIVYTIKQMRRFFIIIIFVRVKKQKTKKATKKRHTNDGGTMFLSHVFLPYSRVLPCNISL